MGILTALINCTTLDQIKAVERKYMELLSPNQRPKFEILLRKAISRINNK